MQSEYNTDGGGVYKLKSDNVIMMYYIYIYIYVYNMILYNTLEIRVGIYE